MGVVAEDYGGPLPCVAEAGYWIHRKGLVRPSEVGQLKKKGLNPFSFTLTY